MQITVDKTLEILSKDFNLSKRLKEISEIEFGDIVDDVILTDINEIRIILYNDSFFIGLVSRCVPNYHP